MLFIQERKDQLVIQKWTPCSVRSLGKPIFQSGILGAAYKVSCNMCKREQNLLDDIRHLLHSLQMLYQRITAQSH